jgi:predicted Fe-Mo cluster-binding NifX family protein
MKIMLPVDNNNYDAHVSNQLGRSEFFLVYDMDNSQGDFYKNEYKNENHGAGVKTAEFILKNKCHALITPRVGERALEILLETDVKIYQSIDGSVTDNLQALKTNNLEVLY